MERPRRTKKFALLSMPGESRKKMYTISGRERGDVFVDWASK